MKQLKFNQTSKKQRKFKMKKTVKSWLLAVLATTMLVLSSEGAKAQSCIKRNFVQKESRLLDSAHRADFGFNIIQDPDSTYLVTFCSLDFTYGIGGYINHYKCHVRRYSKDLVMLSNDSFDLPWLTPTKFWRVKGGYLASTNTGVIKLDSKLKKKWIASFGWQYQGGRWSYLSLSEQLDTFSDGSVVVSGKTWVESDTTHKSDSIFTAKINSTGKISWIHFRKPTNHFEWPEALAVVRDSFYVAYDEVTITDTVHLSGKHAGCNLMVYDSSGKFVRTKSFDSTISIMSLCFNPKSKKLATIYWSPWVINFAFLDKSDNLVGHQTINDWFGGRLYPYDSGYFISGYGNGGWSSDQNNKDITQPVYAHLSPKGDLISGCWITQKQIPSYPAIIDYDGFPVLASSYFEDSTHMTVQVLKLTKDSAIVVKVLSPNGGEVYHASAYGSSDSIPVNISTENMPKNTRMSISLVDTSCKSCAYTPILVDTNIIDHYTFQVDGRGMSFGKIYKIRVAVWSNDGLVYLWDESDNTFTITNDAPSIQLLSPTGGEKFIGGNVIPIKWKILGKIPVSTNGKPTQVRVLLGLFAVDSLGNRYGFQKAICVSGVDHYDFTTSAFLLNVPDYFHGKKWFASLLLVIKQGNTEWDYSAQSDSAFSLDPRPLEILSSHSMSKPDSSTRKNVWSVGYTQRFHMKWHDWHTSDMVYPYIRNTDYPFGNDSGYYIVDSATKGSRSNAPWYGQDYWSYTLPDSTPMKANGGKWELEVQKYTKGFILKDQMGNLHRVESETKFMVRKKASPPSFPTTPVQVVTRDTVGVEATNNSITDLPQEGELTVYDLMGRKLLSHQLVSGESLINQNLNNGCYLFTVQTGNKVYSKKVLILNK